MSRVLMTVGGLGLVSAMAGAAAERKVLRAVAQTPSPAGWKTPRFPGGTELMVPTDDGAELLVVITGPAEGRPIVLVHGLTSSHHDWGPVAEHLVADGFRVIAINQRGHGGSTIGEDGFGAARLGADVGQVLGALGLDNVVLCGHSMGGVAAMGLLALRPETGAHRVGSLALVSTLAHTEAPERKATLRAGNSRVYKQLAAHPIHAPVVARYAFGRLPSRAMVDAALASNAQCPRETRQGASLGLLDYDIRPVLDNIEVPTVVICGDKDFMTPLSENRMIAEGIGAELRVAEGAGHLVIWEQPQLIAQELGSLAARPSSRALN